jgi:hypothetical protein
VVEAAKWAAPMKAKVLVKETAVWMGDGGIWRGRDRKGVEMMVSSGQMFNAINQSMCGLKGQCHEIF